MKKSKSYYTKRINKNSFERMVNSTSMGGVQREIVNNLLKKKEDENGDIRFVNNELYILKKLELEGLISNMKPYKYPYPIPKEDSKMVEVTCKDKEDEWTTSIPESNLQVWIDFRKSCAPTDGEFKITKIKYFSDLNLSMEHFELMFEVLWLIKITHWSFHGLSNSAYHELLNDMYHKLDEYIDEYIESTQALPNKIEPLQLTPLVPEKLVKVLMNLNKTLLQIQKNELLSDWAGRFISDINIWIYKLIDRSEVKLFSSTNREDILEILKATFRNQDEFLFAYNSWLKGKRLKDKISKIFVEHDEDLYGLSTEMLDKDKKYFNK